MSKSRIRLLFLVAGILAFALFYFFQTGISAQSRERVSSDPAVRSQYLLEIGGKFFGYFTEASGIGSTTDVVYHKVVNEDGMEVVRVIPGRLQYTDITLVRGITSNLAAWAWRWDVEMGNIAKASQDLAIVVLSGEGQKVARWEIKRGWPRQITTDGTMEALTIAHEGIKRIF